MRLSEELSTHLIAFAVFESFLVTPYMMKKIGLRFKERGGHQDRFKDSEINGYHIIQLSILATKQILIMVK